ncbi:unnamed protein product [Peronospora destructor]|uniref:Uncharacterized protein n=1 Tax=Peronospora destructor TaxID=86335 RepID=A0AAV0V152_9STRA|nr:unnamed protein product [Peronospora destructor]
MSTVAVAPARYFSFKNFLSEAEAVAFFEVPHAEQVVKVEQYLEFLGKQPNSTQFTASSKASISSADSAAKSYSDDGGTVVLDAALLQQLLDGRTRSGFGAFGTEPGFLPQKRLSLTVAYHVEKTYIVERNKRGIVKPPELLFLLVPRGEAEAHEHPRKAKRGEGSITIEMSVLATNRDCHRPSHVRRLYPIRRVLCTF